MKFKVTYNNRVIFEDGAGWNDVPQVTGDDIKAFRQRFGLRQLDLARLLNGFTKNYITMLESNGPKPLPDLPVRAMLALLIEANQQPVMYWEPEHIAITVEDVAGYFDYCTCVECGKGFFNTNVQRRRCKTCAPYDGVGAKK